MSYQVLARKWRPTCFEEVVGQEHVVKALQNSLKQNMIHQSYLLSGTRGVGKTTIARILTKCLNCEEGLTSTPCLSCLTCKSISEGNFMDFQEVDAASRRGVEETQQLLETVMHMPGSSRYKVYLIDEVHMLSKSAFNALLKTLEEPPPHIKFIFATTEVKKIPITILSRCQRFDLHRIENKLLTSHLFKVSELEKINIEQDAMTLIVRAADGSVRDGLSLLDQAIVNQNESISANQIIDMLGLADRGKIFDLLDYIFQGNAIKALQIYNELYQAGADIIMIFDEMLNAVHFITEIKIAPNLKEDIFIPELERVKGSEISAKLTMATLGLVWQVLFKGYQELQEGFHLHQHGEMIILRLIYLHDGPTPEDLLKEYKEQDKNKSEDISKKNPITPTQINRNETINTKEENFNLPDNKNSIKSNFSITVDSYRNFVDLFYQQKEGILHTQLYNSVKLISFKVGELNLNTDSIKDPHFNRTVAKLISKWTGRIWQIHTSTSNVGKSLYEEDLINQQKEIEKMKNHPEIKQILEAFPGVSIHSITDITETTDEKNVISIKRKEKEV